MLIHLHIAKTGGTSLNSMIKHAFAKDDILELIHPTPGAMQQTPRKYLKHENKKYISGHVPLCIHGFYPDAQLITTIRNPIDRVNSFFHYQADDVGRYMKNSVTFEEYRPVTFEEYVFDAIDVQMHNYQTRVLCGLWDVEFMGRQQSPPVVFLNGNHLHRAKMTIERYFLAAPMERLTELGLVLRRKYGWPMRKIQSERMNSSKTPPIQPHIRRRLENYNLLDLELHEWVTKQFAAAPLLDHVLYTVTNTALRTAGKVFPWETRKRIAKRVLGWS